MRYRHAGAGAVRRASAPVAGALLLSIAAALHADASPRVLRCAAEGEDAEPMRVADGLWQEWEHGRWGGNLCGRRLDGARGRETWHCRFTADAWELEYALADGQDHGVYRRVEHIDRRTGAYHRRIVDDTFVLAGGTRLEMNHYGSCMPGVDPLPGAAGNTP